MKHGESGQVESGHQAEAIKKLSRSYQSNLRHSIIYALTRETVIGETMEMRAAAAA
jgi:hypothetical protein